MGIEKTLFDKTAGGEAVSLYTLKNDFLTLGVLDYGATVRSPEINAAGGKRDVVGGYDTLAEYEKNDGYQGAVIGRFANRIAGGKFSLNGREYNIFQNDFPNTLHGGRRGFDKKIWKAETGEDSIAFTLFSPDRDENYPGDLSVRVTYTLLEKGFAIGYEATASADTVLNLTNHSYFNLSGFDGNTVLDHTLKLNCSHFTPIDEKLIPTGKIASVDGTPFDFREEKKIGRDIGADDEQLKLAGGYDHNFIIDRIAPKKFFEKTLYEAARLTSPDGALSMCVFTDQPGVQVYSGNFMHDDIIFKRGVKQIRRSAVCLETQHFPDSPNKPDFPTAVLRAGDKFETLTAFTFKN
ncbi:MAG: galactose mutarotase [Clostridia bacterium]|nr:galactose mutarotase [Clostridia bacterium]